MRNLQKVIYLILMCGYLKSNAYTSADKLTGARKKNELKKKTVVKNWKERSDILETYAYDDL